MLTLPYNSEDLRVGEFYNCFVNGMEPRACDVNSKKVNALLVLLLTVTHRQDVVSVVERCELLLATIKKRISAVRALDCHSGYQV